MSQGRQERRLDALERAADRAGVGTACQVCGRDRRRAIVVRSDEEEARLCAGCRDTTLVIRVRYVQVPVAPARHAWGAER